MAAHAALAKQTEELAILDVRALSSVTDFFVVGTASTPRQLSAIVEQIDHELSAYRQRVWHVEGMTPPSGEDVAAGEPLLWVLIDCGDVVVHLFNPPARTFYQLEHLWADAPQLSFDGTAGSPAQAERHETGGALAKTKPRA